MITFRDAIKDRIGPYWVRFGTNLALMASAAIHVELVADMVFQAVVRAFPGAGNPPDALGRIGAARGIRRGPSETAEHYAARLEGWLDAHARKGSPQELLRQVRGYFEQWAAFPAVLVYRNGRTYTQDEAGDITISEQDFAYWDDEPERWARWFLFLYPPSALTVTAEQLRLLLEDWNSAHCIGYCAVLPPGAHVWGEPGLTWGEPGLTWGDDGAPPIVIKDILA